jgi:hypothetical protein
MNRLTKPNAQMLRGRRAPAVVAVASSASFIAFLPFVPINIAGRIAPEHEVHSESDPIDPFAGAPKIHAEWSFRSARSR